ncbi:Spy/CpxP family protein refolding chaperone [Piscinibacter sp. HJYY11]|uniref:Spy/CpxP family protein refolding chaperone n=1 Tax=Piscinibacter sp. HJYY11 TaxID=2801333 RepID=UPI00191E3944|nr:Spy/CpxP family protein refolding chaperone [Piscinibacter sp. HJYY11]MBL0726500.1 Spy/CpxP family protein refolding chaperone [Piscinibacter sp. HJYY11]
MRSFLLTLLVAGVASGSVAGAMTLVHAEHNPKSHTHSSYSGMESRAIKALSSEQIADLRAGKGMGASLPAELNGVPGPMHVLELRERLNLTPQQATQLERIVAAMKERAQSLGEQVIGAETRLDRAFASGTADEALVQASAAHIGELQGQLRAVHLVAHLQTKALMSREQVGDYNRLRGYTN